MVDDYDTIYGNLTRAVNDAEFNTVKHILLAGMGLVGIGDIHEAENLCQLAEDKYGHITGKYRILSKSTKALRRRIELKKEKYGQKNSEETRPVGDA